MSALIRLTLKAVEAQLVNLNTRAEKLGPKEYQPAADIKIKMQVPGDTLNSFSKTLMDQLFKCDLASPIPRESDLVYPVRYNGEMTEVEVVIKTGLDKEMKFQDSKVNTFDLTPLKGGYVEMCCRVQFHPTPEQAGMLYAQQMKTLEISMTPPPVREPEAKKPSSRPAKPADGEKGTAGAAPLH